MAHANALISIPRAPIFLKFRSSKTFILTTVALALFTDLFLYGIVVPLIPFILTSRLGIPHEEIQSYTSLLLGAFATASLLFSLPAGIIADKLSARQIPFTGGLLALVASTLLLATGRRIEVLVLARVLQGTSACVVWTVGIALVRDTVGSGNLGLAMGSISGFINVGELLAPVVGGVVYEKAGNWAVFGICLGLLGLDVVLRFCMIEKKVAEKYGVENEEDGDEEAQNENSPLLKTPTNDPLEDFRLPDPLPRYLPNPLVYVLCNSPRIIVAQLVSLMQSTVIALFDATLPIQVQSLFGFTSLETGLIFIPLILPGLLLGPIAGRGVDKYGVKIFGTLGYLYLTIPLILLRIPQAGSTNEVVKLVIVLALCGPGITAVGALSVVEASKVMEKYEEANPDAFGKEGPYATLYAINTMVYSSGMVLGPAIAGLLKESIGYGNMNLVVAGLCLVLSGLCFVYLGGTPKILRSWRVRECETP